MKPKEQGPFVKH